MPETVPSSVTAWTSRLGRRRARSPTCRRRTRIHLCLRNITRQRGSEHMMETATTTSLELDDIQSGALHERPSPYVGMFLLVRIDDRRAGREMVRRLLAVVDSARS